MTERRHALWPGRRRAERPGGTGFGGAGRERLGAVAQGIARQVHEHFEAIHLPAEADALRDSFQSFAVDGHGSVFVATQGGLLRCNRIAGAINCSQRKCCSAARSMLWLGRRTTRSGLRQETGLGAFCREDPNPRMSRRLNCGTNAWWHCCLRPMAGCGSERTAGWGSCKSMPLRQECLGWRTSYDGQYAGRSYAGPSGQCSASDGEGLYWRDGEGEARAKATRMEGD